MSATVGGVYREETMQTVVEELQTNPKFTWRGKRRFVVEGKRHFLTSKPEIYLEWEDWGLPPPMRLVAALIRRALLDAQSSVEPVRQEARRFLMSDSCSGWLEDCGVEAKVAKQGFLKELQGYWSSAGVEV